MKRLFTLIVGFAVLWIAGCDLQMPETVEVKASPSFEVPGGSRDVVLSEVWDVNKALEDAAAGIEGLSVADTAPTDPMALTLRKGLIDISMDDFAGESLDPTVVNQAIELSYDAPSIDIPTQSIEANIDPIPVPTDVALPDVSLKDIPEANGSYSHPDSLAGTGYETVTFHSGTLYGAVQVANGSAGLTVTVTSATITDTSGNTITEATNVPVGSGGSLEFPLVGRVLPKNFDILLGIDISGASTGEFFDLDTIFSFSSDTALSAATGITSITHTVSDTHNITLDPTLQFQSATVGAGNLAITVPTPTGWTGFDPVEVKVTLTQAAAPLPWTGTWPAAAPVDLAGLEIGNQDIGVDYDVTVSGSNASFTLDPAANEISAEVSGSLTNFSELVISDGSIDTSVSLSPINIPQDIQEFVASAKFLNPILSVTLDNQLPAGIDVDLDLSASELVYPDSTTTALVFDTPSKSFTNGILAEETWNLANPTLTMDFSQISVIPNVTLSDGTSDGTLTLMNVSPGDTFSLTGSAEATLVIDELVIDSYTMPLSSYPEDTTNPLDFSMLADYLPPSVTLNDVSATLEMNPSDLTGLSLFLNAKYGGADHILFGSGTPASPGLDPLSPTQNIDLQQIVNDAPADLIFEYVVSASNATITSDPANENRFGAVLDAHIGLSFTSNSQDGSNEISINGSPVVERVQDDILGRTGNPDEDDQLTEFLLFAKEVTINMAVTNNTGLGLRAEIVEPAEGDLDEFKLTFDIGPNDSNADMGLTLGNAQIQRIADDTDFRPEVHLYIPDSPSGESYMLRTDANATISAWLGLETDISYEFDLTESGGEE